VVIIMKPRPAITKLDSGDKGEEHVIKCKKRGWNENKEWMSKRDDSDHLDRSDLFLSLEAFILNLRYFKGNSAH
jgi:hypothetical protein